MTHDALSKLISYVWLNAYNGALISLGMMSILLLTACATTLTTGTTMDQAERTVQQIICDTFHTIRFTQSMDSGMTVVQVREHNAVLETFNCEELQ